MAKTKKILESVEETANTVSDIKIQKLIPNVIDNYIVGILDDHHTVVVPMNITGTQFRAWYKGKGGIFSKDVLHYSLGLEHGKYVLIKGAQLNCVARLISEEEELHFKTMKLVDGQIKDRPYMILKNLQNGEKLSGTQRYINEKTIELEEIEYIPDTKITPADDDVDHPVRSISLFAE